MLRVCADVEVGVERPGENLGFVTPVDFAGGLYAGIDPPRKTISDLSCAFC